jgi:hypothetical protein
MNVMSQKIGPYLEQLGQGRFRLLGELPEGSVDAHLHLGTYLRMPMLGGMNLTGPGGFRENLGFHVSELRKHGTAICDGLRDLSPAALEGVIDVPFLKTEMRGPASEPVHLFTSMDGLFDRDAPCYLGIPTRLSLSLLRDLGAALKGFSGAIREANVANLLRYLEAYGLARAVALPVESGRFSRFSETALDACEGIPQVVPFLSVHPRYPDMEERFSSLVRRGAKGVKFHPEFQGAAPDSKEALRLFELCAAAGLPVVCHVGGVQAGAQHSHPNRYEAAVKLFPDLRFVLCHAGLADREAALEMARRHDNVLLETSGQPVEGLRQAAARIGSERMLFGSDWPLYHPAVPMSCVLEAFPRDADRERVFRDNFFALMGWSRYAGPGKKTEQAEKHRAVVRKPEKPMPKTARVRKTADKESPRRKDKAKRPARMKPFPGKEGAGKQAGKKPAPNRAGVRNKAKTQSPPKKAGVGRTAGGKPAPKAAGGAKPAKKKAPRPTTSSGARRA